jgi:prevent-host-death family protein
MGELRVMRNAAGAGEPLRFKWLFSMATLRAMQVSVAEAKNKLPELIKVVESGETVTICRRGVPVVDLVRTEMSGTRKPKFGTLRGRIKINDPDWWKPMSGKEAEAFIEPRDSEG